MEILGQLFKTDVVNHILKNVKLPNPEVEIDKPY